MTPRRTPPPAPRVPPAMQLSMEMSAARARMMPAAPVPDGFDLRPHRAGDEESWTDLIATGGFGPRWERARFDEYMKGAERRAGSRVAARGGRIFAATFASVEAGAEGVGRVDFVVARPEARGKGLGRAVCSAVVRYLVGRGYRSVVLYTDDWRLPAIGLYLSMGFEPRMNGADMPARWDAVRAALG